MNRSFIGIALLLACTLPQFISAQADIPSRAPFSLELPGISSERFTSPIVRIAYRDVPMIRFYVTSTTEPVNYGSIVATVNGWGINRDCGKRSNTTSRILDCRPASEFPGGYTLHPGKNVVEIRATSTNEKREFYASFVLILGDKEVPSEQSRVGPTEQFHGKKYALVVGVSDYSFRDIGLKNLAFAHKDAEAVSAFLKTPAGGSFPAANTTLLLNKDANLIALRSTFEKIGKSARAEDLVFVYIAGHGAPDPFAPQNLYFLLSDTKVAAMSMSAFPMQELKTWLDTELSAKRVIMIIDTCHSAGVGSKSFVAGRELKHGEENNLSSFYATNRLFHQEGRAILTSSDVNEVSQESPKWQNHGVFTWAFLEGLKGGADVDKDNLITIGEAFNFTRSMVQRETNLAQNPRALPGTNTNLVIAQVGRK